MVEPNIGHKEQCAPLSAVKRVCALARVDSTATTGDYPAAEHRKLISWGHHQGPRTAPHGALASGRFAGHSTEERRHDRRWAPKAPFPPALEVATATFRTMPDAAVCARVIPR
jgi:hypothetical protein